MKQDIKNAFLTLVRLGIGNDDASRIVRYHQWPESLEWDDIRALADKQGLGAVLLDGIENLPDELRPPKALLLQWIGDTLQGYEYRYELYKRAHAEMAAFYREHGIKMMLLKGYACCLDWPTPAHRPVGDIDIWLFGKQTEADTLLKNEKGIKIDNSHHHHSVFYWRDFMVENHYDFINVHHHKSNLELEAVFKELGQDDTHSVEVYGETVYLPSPNLHALFLLRHTMNHFATTKMTLRQLLDWAFFVKNRHKELDWQWLEEKLEDFGMMPLYDILNAICVEELGFSSQLFPRIQFSPYLKDRVKNEILEPETSGKTPSLLLPRVVFKYRRWKANSWKHKLCYKESMRSALWSGIKNHLLKPSSI